MKKRMSFKVPPTRREWREAEVVKAMQELYPERSIRGVKWTDGMTTEQYQAAVVGAGGFARGAVTVVVYEHEDGCPKNREQSFAVEGGGGVPQQHGECTCNADVTAYLPEKEAMA